MAAKKQSWFKRQTRRLARAVAKRAIKFAGIPLRDPALVSMFGRNPAESGIDVDEDSALNFSAYWRGVSLLSQSIAMLGKRPFKEGKDGRTVAKTHSSYYPLAVSPNPEMTPFVFDETLQAHALTWGNGYAHIERAGSDPQDPVLALWPLMPNQMIPERDGEKLVYRFFPMFEGEKDETFQAHEVLHVPGLGFDGLKGYSVVQRAREGIGLGLATERTGAAFFGRGSIPGGVLEHPGELTETARKNLRETWEQMHRGPDNAHRIAILEEGIKYNATAAMSYEDMQFLLTRKFQVVEIARWLGIPPHMLYELEQSTNNNIEHQGLEFLTYSLLPWLMKWAQEYRRKLFREDELPYYEIEYNVNVLLKTDIKTRFEAYTQARNGGWYTLNDILKQENMNPVAGSMGDSRLMPSTMVVMGEHVKGIGESPDVSQVEDTALNGPQVTSLLTILQAVSANQLDPDSANAMITAAFPAVPPNVVMAMLAPYKGKK